MSRQIDWAAFDGTKELQVFSALTKNEMAVWQIAQMFFNNRVKPAKESLLRMIDAGMVDSPYATLTSKALILVNKDAVISQKSYNEEQQIELCEAAFLDWMNHEAKKNHEEKLAKFVERVEKDAIDAFNWAGSGIIKTQTELHEANRCKAGVEARIEAGATQREAVISVAKALCKDVIDSLVRGDFASGCTCPMTNLTRMWKCETMGKMVDGFSSIAHAINKLANVGK